MNEEQLAILRKKIYDFCYDYVGYTGGIYNPTPQFLLNQGKYEIDQDDNFYFFSALTDVVCIPYDFVEYENFDKYFQYYSNYNHKPLSIKLVADIYLKWANYYHTLWADFKMLPKEQQDDFYQKIFTEIENIILVKISADTVINKGQHAIRLTQAERLYDSLSLKFHMDAFEVESSFEYVRHPSDPIYSDQPKVSFHPLAFICSSLIVGYINFHYGMIFVVIYISSWLAIRYFKQSKKRVNEAESIDEYFAKEERYLEPITAQNLANQVIDYQIIDSYKRDKSIIKQRKQP